MRAWWGKVNPGLSQGREKVVEVRRRRREEHHCTVLPLISLHFVYDSCLFSFIWTSVSVENNYLKIFTMLQCNSGGKDLTFPIS